MLVQRRNDLLTTPRPEFLATREEQVELKRLNEIESGLQGVDTAQAAAMKQRVKRLKGLLTWTLVTKYDERLTRFDENLRHLDEAMTVAQSKYDEFVRKSTMQRARSRC